MEIGKLTRTLSLVAAIALPAAAQAAVLDFDALDSSNGQAVPLTGFSEDGYTFGLSFTANLDARGPAIFDTTCVGSACNGDTDLIPAVQGENGVRGNVLILQEQRPSPVPDDDGQGGTITFTLLSGPAFRLLGASAVDDGRFSFSTPVDGLLGTISLSSDNQTGRTTFGSPSSLIGVGGTFSVAYSGSGGVDSLVISAVPIPAALPLLVGALGGLGFVARRRRRAA